MTIVAWDGNTLAADRLHTFSGGLISEYKCKLYQWTNGWWSSCGYTKDGQLFQGWLETGKIKGKLGKDFEALYSDADNIVYYVDRELIPELAPVPCAIGVAWKECLTLLKTGYNATEATIALTKIHTGVGGKVDAVLIKKNNKRGR